jgi:hypothetical protein
MSSRSPGWQVREALVAARPSPALPVPWRDPQTASPVELASYIAALERACEDNPASSDLRTVLGIAHAVNYDVPKSLEVLEEAIAIDPDSFWANLKYAEIHYRLRALTRAEELSLAAVNLATNGWQLSLARKQLNEVRRLKRNCARNLSWKMPIVGPLLAFAGTLLLVAAAFTWR